MRYCKVFFLLAILAWSANAALAQECIQSTGYTPRVEIFNNCADQVHVIITTPDDDASRALWQNVGTTDSTVIETGTHNSYKMTKPIAPQGSQTLCLPDAGAAGGNIQFLLKCEDTGNTVAGWPTGCLNGTPGQDSNGVNSVFELTPGCKYSDKSLCSKNPVDGTPLSVMEYFDLSVIDGYTIPMDVQILGADPKTTYQCTYAKRSAIVDLASCPYENSNSFYAQYIKDECGIDVDAMNDGKGPSMVLLDDVNKTLPVACMSVKRWVDSPVGQNKLTAACTTKLKALPQPSFFDWYGCAYKNGDDGYPALCTTPGCGGPQCAVGPLGKTKDYAHLTNGLGKPYINRVKTLKYTGNEAYAWEFNDDASTLVCHKWGASVKLTLCPGQAGQKPYDLDNQKWAYDATTMKCGVNTSGAYTSLAACSEANYKFYCGTETVQKLSKDGIVANNAVAHLHYCVPVTTESTAAQKASAVSLSQCQNSPCQATGQLSIQTPAQSLLLLNE